MNLLKVKPAYKSLLSVLLGALLVTGTAHAVDVRKIDMGSPEGLTLVKNEKHRVVYVNDAVDWNSYKTFQVMEPRVAFKKNWKREQNLDRRLGSDRVDDKDVQRIKAGLSEMVKTTFEEKLSEKGNLKLVAEVGSDTLLLKPSIIKLDVNAPDTMSAGSSKTYVESAGEGTLFLEVYDGVSGDLLARILDFRKARDNGYFEWATRVSNRRDAQQVINYWGNRLVDALEQARESSVEL